MTDRLIDRKPDTFAKADGTKIGTPTIITAVDLFHNVNAYDCSPGKVGDILSPDNRQDFSNIEKWISRLRLSLQSIILIVYIFYLLISFHHNDYYFKKHEFNFP